MNAKAPRCTTRPKLGSASARPRQVASRDLPRGIMVHEASLDPGRAPLCATTRDGVRAARAPRACALTGPRGTSGGLGKRDHAVAWKKRLSSFTTRGLSVSMHPGEPRGKGAANELDCIGLLGGVRRTPSAAREEACLSIRERRSRRRLGIGAQAPDASPIEDAIDELEVMEYPDPTRRGIVTIGRDPGPRLTARYNRTGRAAAKLLRRRSGSTRS